MNDYHLHTSLCKHAYGQIAEFVEAALRKGLEEICFSDHNPMPGGYDPNHRMDEDEIELYVDLIDRARGRFPEITILTGIEMDYLQGHEAFIEKLVKDFDFDLVIMSIHFIKEWGENNWVFSFDFPEKTMVQIYSEYFSAMSEGIKTGLFDVAGHFDLIKRPDHPLLESNSGDVDRVLAEIKEQGMGLELNTSGLRKWIGETYPSLDIIERAVSLGVPLTFGSDAHTPEQVGFRFREIGNIVTDLPGLKIAAYRQRKLKLLGADWKE